MGAAAPSAWSIAAMTGTGNDLRNSSLPRELYQLEKLVDVLAWHYLLVFECNVFAGQLRVHVPWRDIGRLWYLKQSNDKELSHSFYFARELDCPAKLTTPWELH